MLEIDNNNIDSMNPLKNCINLEYLYIKNTNIRNITEIKFLERLKNINLNKEKIESIDTKKYNLFKEYFTEEEVLILYKTYHNIRNKNKIEKLEKIRKEKKELIKNEIKSNLIEIKSNNKNIDFFKNDIVF